MNNIVIEKHIHEVCTVIPPLAERTIENTEIFLRKLRSAPSETTVQDFLLTVDLKELEDMLEYSKYFKYEVDLDKAKKKFNPLDMPRF